MSGAPGTGKTATLTHLLKTKTSDYKSVFLNCMVLKSSIQIFKEVAKQLNPKTTAKSEKEALKEIEKFTTGKGPMVLLGNLFYTPTKIFYLVLCCKITRFPQKYSPQG